MTMTDEELNVHADRITKLMLDAVKDDPVLDTSTTGYPILMGAAVNILANTASITIRAATDDQGRITHNLDHVMLQIVQSYLIRLTELGEPKPPMTEWLSEQALQRLVLYCGGTEEHHA